MQHNLYQLHNIDESFKKEIIKNVKTVEGEESKMIYPSQYKGSSEWTYFVCVNGNRVEDGMSK